MCGGDFDDSDYGYDAVPEERYHAVPEDRYHVVPEERNNDERIMKAIAGALIANELLAGDYSPAESVPVSAPQAPLNKRCASQSSQKTTPKKQKESSVKREKKKAEPSKEESSVKREEKKLAPSKEESSVSKSSEKTQNIIEEKGFELPAVNTMTQIKEYNENMQHILQQENAKMIQTMQMQVQDLTNELVQSAGMPVHPTNPDASKQQEKEPFKRKKNEGSNTQRYRYDCDYDYHDDNTGENSTGFNPDKIIFIVMSLIVLTCITKCDVEEEYSDEVPQQQNSKLIQKGHNDTQVKDAQMQENRQRQNGQ